MRNQIEYGQQSLKDKDNDIEQVENYFNSDSVHLVRIRPKFENTGLFPLYEKADTLEFKASFTKQPNPLIPLEKQQRRLHIGNAKSK